MSLIEPAANSRELAANAEAEWHPAHNPWLISLTVITATFMEVLDTSVANVALPHIAGNLAASVDESTWVLTSYLVSNAIVLPLSGWFSDVFGRKRFFMICVGLFIGSSLMCGLAPSLEALVFFRVLQGAGGGALQPTAQAILVETFSVRKRGMAMAIYGMGVVVAPIVGPTLGGWITDNYTWRWVFFINVPVGLFSLFLTGWLVSDPPYLKPKGFKGIKIDYIGLGLLSLGLGCMQIMLDRGQRDDWFASYVILALFIICVTSLIALVFWELRQRDPVLELRLFRERNYLISTITMFTLGFVLYGSIALLPIFLQTLLGYTAMLAGLVLSPGGLVTLFVFPLVGWMLGRYEPRWLVLIGVVFVTASLFLMAGFNLQIDFYTAAKARVIQGLGLAFLFVPINVMAFYFIPKEKTNYATGMINLARNVGGGCGIAFVTTVLARASQYHQNVLVGHITALSDKYRDALDGTAAFLGAQGSEPLLAQQQAQNLIYYQVQRQAMMLAFIDAFRWLAYAFLLLVPLMFLMKRIKTKA
jgi:MFS transporter, DHA2 family, multidrug resistance protein